MAEINNLPTNVSDGQTGHLDSHQVIHAALKDHEARVGGAESGLQATKTTATQALTTANSARSISTEAVGIAGTASGVASNAVNRVAALEGREGLSPESPVDGQTANLIEQSDTLTRAALETGLTSVYASRLHNPSHIGADVEKRINGKKVLVVFRHDDVQPSALAYLPVYRQYGVKASWYMTTGHAGSSSGPNSAPIVSWEQLDEIFADGHEIGSHTVNHAYINTPRPLTDAEWEKELEDSKRTLEDRYGHTGYTCDTLALPGNQIPVTDATENIALDYYMTLLSGGPLCSSLKGVQELITWRNAYHWDWLDYTDRVRTPGATLETDRAVVRARIDEIAEYDGGAGGISVIQAHNQSELSVPQLEMMLEEFAADDRVAVITVRDWVHYCRRKYVTTDGGKHFYPPKDANKLVHTAGNIRSTYASLTGDLSLNGPGAGIYYIADGTPQFRIYQTQSDRLRVRDMVAAKDALTITRGNPSVPTTVAAESFIASQRFSLSNFPEVANYIHIFLGAGPPTEALGVQYKGCLYIQADGDPDSCLWVKTTAGTGGWKLVGHHGARRTSAQILDVSDTINTEAKTAGRCVFDTTLNMPLWANGSSPYENWSDATGTIVHRPWS